MRNKGAGEDGKSPLSIGLVLRRSMFNYKLIFMLSLIPCIPFPLSNAKLIIAVPFSIIYFWCDSKGDINGKPDGDVERDED
jgi:hypothetical protein